MLGWSERGREAGSTAPPPPERAAQHAGSRHVTRCRTCDLLCGLRSRDASPACNERIGRTWGSGGGCSRRRQSGVAKWCNRGCALQDQLRSMCSLQEQSAHPTAGPRATPRASSGARERPAALPLLLGNKREMLWQIGLPGALQHALCSCRHEGVICMQHMSRQQAALCSLVACPPSSIATAQRIASPAGAIPSPHPRSWLQLQRRQRRCAHRARTVRRIRVAIQPAAARRGSWPRSSVAAAAHPPSDAGMWRRATDLLVCATIDQPVPPAAACPCRYTIELPAAAADDSRQAGRLRRRRRSARAAAAPWRTRATRSAMASPRRSRA